MVIVSFALALAGCGEGTLSSPRGDGAMLDAPPAEAGPPRLEAGVGGDAGGGVDAGTGDSGTTPDASPRPEAGTGTVVPPLGGSSGGSGGGAASGSSRTTPSGVTYLVRVPSSYRDSAPNGLMVVFSGTEGASTMMMNLQGIAGRVGLGDLIFAVLDGPTYYANGMAGADALEHVRVQYNIDNDRTYLLSESAGTRAGLQLGFRLRQSYFAAFWANDVNAASTPGTDAADLGFAPWGNAGPGGDFPDASAIVAGMRAAGYRVAEPAPYDGPGAAVHGHPDQFVAALRWFARKTRR